MVHKQENHLTYFTRDSMWYKRIKVQFPTLAMLMPPGDIVNLVGQGNAQKGHVK